MGFPARVAVSNALAIATSDACAKVNGKFLPIVFNWMVHANLYEAEVWADHH